MPSRNQDLLKAKGKGRRLVVPPPRMAAAPRQETLTPRSATTTSGANERVAFDAMHGSMLRTPQHRAWDVPSDGTTQNPALVAGAPNRRTGAAASAPAWQRPKSRGGSDPDSKFGRDNRWAMRAGKAAAITSPVRGPKPRTDGKPHAEDSLRLPYGHEFQDIDEYPPKGFPAHLRELTSEGGGKRLPVQLDGITFHAYKHADRSGHDAEHMGNVSKFEPGIRKTAAGKLFVQKIGLPNWNGTEPPVDMSRKSTNQEVIADRIFRILGVPAPRSQVYSLKTGLPVPHDYKWASGEGSTRISEHLGKDSHTAWHLDPSQYPQWERHERRYAVAKALLDHGDDHAHNTMFDGHHTDIPWKVDNGSALQFNAMGSLKNSYAWSEVNPSDVLFPQVYDVIKKGVVTPREAYRQMEKIAKIWRRHRGSIETLYKNEEDPNQIKIFSSRAESIARAVDLFKGPREFARAMNEHMKDYGEGGGTPLGEFAKKRRRRSSGSGFMARSLLMFRANLVKSKII